MALPRRRLRARRAATALVAAMATAAGLLAMASGAPAATTGPSVSVNEVYTIPTTGPSAGKFSIFWRGNGHGHGLSQYGAKGAAEKGLTFSQILAFYYPGTTQTKAGGNIRVQLSAVPRDSLQVLPTSTLTVIDTGNSNASTVLPTTVNGTQVKKWRLGVNTQGRTIVSYLQAAWKTYRTLMGDGEFIDPTLGYVTLLDPTTTRYRGGLLAASAVSHDLHRYAVNVVSLDQYVAGVVPSEMPTSWPQPALRSQAIAARTYALFERAEHRGNYYDICDTTWCQVYGGMNAEVASSTNATNATKGIYLAYQGRPAFTQFSSSNGGWESYGGQPYLPSQADPYTPSSEQVYNRPYSWSMPDTSVSPLQSAYPAIGTLKSVTITKREGGDGATWKGRVLAMTLTGNSGSQVISGGTFAAIFGLSSTWFTLQVAAPAATAPSYSVGRHVAPGWSASLGKPIGPEIATTAFGLAGYYQRFSGGHAIIRSKYGTFASNGSIFATWNPQQRGWPTAHLTSGTVNGRAGWVQTFQKGRYGRDYAFATGKQTVWVNGRPS